MVEARASQVGARKRKKKIGNFTERTENWFLQADRIIQEAESGDLPPERGGGYLEPPWWQPLASLRVGVFALAVVGVAAALVWAVG